MCGLAGSTRATRKELEAMAARLAHRGPDDAGLWLLGEGATGLAHRRLSVIDLSTAAAQPMVSDCGRYVLAYNGEIYNFAALRADLEAKGERFRSHSDTEVLLNLLRRDGVGALDRLVGMFAFALWDRQDESLLLARDRLGIKPLVYAALDGGDIAFASEIDALRAHSGIDLSLDRRALSDYLACLYVPAPRTIHAGIHKLPPGHVLQWTRGKTVVRRWWQPAVTGEEEIGLDDAVEELLPLVRQAVVDRLVSDVPVGCFLSGGIDSSVIAALMAAEAERLGAEPIRTFTMTFESAAYDERDNARRVADHIGARHTELPATADLVGLLDDSLAAFGEPFGNPTSLLIHDLSKKAREHVTVALVGDGGDEVFAGYPRYAGGLLASRLDSMVPRGLRRGLMAPAGRLIPESTRGRHVLRRAREFLQAAALDAGPRYASWVEYFSPGERQALLGTKTIPASPIARLYDQAPSAHPLDAMQQTDLGSFLPGNLLAYGDAMSMRHGLELRLPLLDHRLLERVQTMNPALRMAKGKKTLLRAVASELLPKAIVEAPKRGFNPPMGIWLRHDLAGRVRERLTKARMAELGLDWPPVKTLLAEHFKGRRDHSLKVWALLVLDAWSRARAETGS